MAKAVAIGEKHLVLGFQGVGMEVTAAHDEKSLRDALAPLARDPEVGLVLVTESLAKQSPQVIDEFREGARAIVVVIPTHEGSQGHSFELMRKAIERSLGVDLLGKD